MGKIKVYTGPMRSGKSDMVVRILKRYCLANKKVVYYTPILDTRTGVNIYIKSVRGEKEYILPVKRLDAEVNENEVIRECAAYEIVAFDEAQFLNEGITELCQKLRQLGKVVLVAGLDMDYLQRPFGYMAQLMAIADDVTKLTAICECGMEAAFTKRISSSKELILIGDEEYLPCCGECYS